MNYLTEYAMLQDPLRRAGQTTADRRVRLELLEMLEREPRLAARPLRNRRNGGLRKVLSRIAPGFTY